MENNSRTNTLFVGIDVHKDSHTAVALSPFGDKVFEMRIGNKENDFVSLIDKAKLEANKKGLNLSFGLEDVHSYGERLSGYLAGEGLPVFAVAPIMVDRNRKNSTHPEKNDSLDASGVAEVLIRRIDSLPRYNLTEVSKLAKQIKDLSLEREYLIKEATRIKNRLHNQLYQMHNSGYRQLFKSIFSQKALRYWKHSFPKGHDPILKRAILRSIKSLDRIREDAKEIEAELATLIEQGGYTLETASGCGTVTAAEIIGEVGDIKRFKSPGSLAKYAGCAPREHSSGKTVRWRKTRSGNRRLNSAFHGIALSQISRSGNKYAKEYYERKISEGKSKSQALVCLRRQLVTIVWMMMKNNAPYNYQKKP